jgi:ppGpp synthetase/RelA/SpoT-type nucleotidyltranferase
VIIPREIRQKYSEDEAHLQIVAQRVRDTLQAFCIKEGFVFDGRAKTVESLAEKIETGRFQSWTELDDLYGCTVAVPLPSDEDTVVEHLTSTFATVAIKKRLTSRKAPEVFRFDSTRFIGQLRAPSGLEPTEPIYKIRFEVQVKTLFELAWAKTTHALAYKSPRIDWRALRLAATLKAAVEQMDLLLSDFQNAMSCIGEAPWREIQRKHIIQEFFLGMQPSIPTEVWPKDLSRFIGNCYVLLEIVQDCQQRKVGDRKLDIYPSAVGKIREFIEMQPGERFPRSISLFQVVLGVLTQTYEVPVDEEVWFPITSEMEMHFPHVTGIQRRFLFT